MSSETPTDLSREAETASEDPCHHGNQNPDPPDPLYERIREHGERMRMRRSRNALPTIFKVPVQIREVDEAAYEPKVVSIGPYHRGKKALEGMEERKLPLAKKFLDRCHPNTSYSDVMTELKGLGEKARDHYFENTDDIQPTQFAEMLLLDACFVLEFCMMHVDGDEFDIFSIGGHGMRFGICADLLKLENQIPFFVLEKLYGSVVNKGTVPPSMVNQRTLKSLVGKPLDLFTLLFLNLRLCFDFVVLFPARPRPKFHHLLHFAHECIVQNLPNDHVIIIFLPLMKLVVSDLDMPEVEPPLIWTPNAVKLSRAGIRFRGKNNGKPLEVTYRNGVVEMTMLKIDRTTNPLYRNFIALEQCLVDTRMYVTKYIWFIDCLVDEAADIALLQQGGVVANSLGSYEKAAEVINKLARGRGDVRSEFSHLDIVMIQLNKHYKSSWPRWRETLIRDYFGSPWMGLSILAAAILLVLTVVSTIYTLLSYERPKK